MIVLPRTRQPTGAAGIASRWSARGFDFLWSATSPGFNAKKGSVTQDFTGVSPVMIPGARALSFAGGGGTQGKFTANIPDSPTNTFVVVGSGLVAQAFNNRLLSMFTGTAGAELYIPSSQTSVTSQEIFTTTNQQYSATGFNLTTAQTWTLVVVQYGVAGTPPLIVINGAVQTVTGTAGVGTLVAGTGQISVGGRPDIAIRQFAGNIALAAHSSQSLTLGEAVQISVNPWQLYEPDVIYVKAASAATFKPAWARGSNASVIGSGIHA